MSRRSSTSLNYDSPKSSEIHVTNRTAGAIQNCVTTHHPRQPGPEPEFAKEEGKLEISFASMTAVFLLQNGRSWSFGYDIPIAAVELESCTRFSCPF